MTKVLTYPDIDIEIDYTAWVTGNNEDEKSDIKVQDLTINKVELFNNRTGERLDVKNFISHKYITDELTDSIEDGDIDDIDIEWMYPATVDIYNPN